MPRYRYDYKSVCWLTMEYLPAFNKYPVILMPAMTVEKRVRLQLWNKFSSHRPYICQ